MKISDLPMPARLDVGAEYQDFVTRTLMGIGISVPMCASRKYQNTVGENWAGWEVKFDGKFRKTGNLFIEWQECQITGQEKRPAGLYGHTDPVVLIQGDYDGFYMIGARHMLNEIRRCIYRSAGHGTADGYLIPLTRVRMISFHHWGDCGMPEINRSLRGLPGVTDD